jgi:hypothetical protein
MLKTLLTVMAVLPTCLSAIPAPAQVERLSPYLQETHAKP